MQLPTLVFNIETKNIQDSKSFDRSIIQEMFKYSHADQEITLTFGYLDDPYADHSNVKQDNFKMKITCKTEELEETTEKLKKSFQKLGDIYG